MRSFSKKLAFVLAAAMVVTAFAPAAQAKAAKEMAINAQGKILYVTDGTGINDAAQVGGGKGNVSSYDFAVSNKPADWKTAYTFAWSSSDEDVITVKNGGLTTAVGVGKADVVCVVTEKATGKATTLKNTVTVKANAADVVITNADDYANTAVEVGDVVDLNRAMYDANGTKAPKRGVVVTDYTRWMAEPSTGVVIDSSNGTYKFTEDAVAGEYKLWCETYQSKKYQATTAKSDVVKVELVKDMTFEVAQKSAQKFTVEFTSPVKTLGNADVALTRILKVGNYTYEYPEQIKSVTLAKDGLSADVVIFGTLADKVNYVVDVKGFESVEKTMTLGNPVSMTIAAKGAAIPYVLTVDAPTEIVCTFYNAEGVDVTTGKENVIFRLENRATDGSYYLAGNKLTIKKENVFPVVIADYQGWIENGKKVGAFSSEPTEFVAFKKAAVVVNGVVSQTVNGKYNSWEVSMDMRKSDTDKKLEVQIEKSDTSKFWVTNNQKFDNNAYEATFTAMNPDIAVVDNNGKLIAFKTGAAYFYVNLAAKKVNAAGYDTATPVGIVCVNVKADKAFSYITLNTDVLTIGTANGFNTASVKVTSYDFENQKFNFDASKAVTVEANMDGFDKNAFASAITIPSIAGKNEVDITFDAQKIVTVLGTKDLAPKAGDAAVVYFTVKYNNKAVDVSVTVQEPSKEADAYVGNYINIETSATYVDALRKLTPNDWNDNTEKAKNVTFKVFELNNGVKVANLPFGAYPANGDAKAVTSGEYVYRVTKDGKDFASSQSGNTVTVAFSGTKDVTNAAGTFTVVDYANMGAGLYEFALYKCYGEGDERVLVQEYSSAVTVELGDAGSYKLVGDVVDNEVSVSASYNVDDAKEILKCFNIKDKDNADVVDRKNTESLDDDTIKTSAKFFVDYSAPANSGYVYVKEITFYEDLGSGVYVPYVVSIDTVLLNK